MVKMYPTREDISFTIKTLGCRVNQYESEQIAASLRRCGFRLAESGKAQVCIVNTCTVTHTADHKSRQVIRRFIRENPQALVVVTGCYVDAKASELREIAGVDVLVPNKNKTKLAEIIAKKFKLSSPSNTDGFFKPLFHTRALVKIQDGCDQFCSYCIVPKVRGKPRSRPWEDVLQEVKGYLNSGISEIVLTGVHLGKYGSDLDANLSLETLVERLIKIPGKWRVRLSSLEVLEITEKLVSLMTKSEKICRHLHIPLQSGDNRILAAMNRNYQIEEYLECISWLKEKIDSLAITTDVIVGFPGEDELAFKRTKEVIEEAKFRKVHVFKFSARPGTPAANFKDQVPEAIKEERSQELLKLASRLEQTFSAAYLGQVLPVLVERSQNGYLTGLTDNYLRVRLEGKAQIGRLINVYITGQEDRVLLGKVLN
jgi:threonylcarbamoyladenosine tRNA methylthiotransferase MtaB